jgi:hypothetical protein
LERGWEFGLKLFMNYPPITDPTFMLGFKPGDRKFKESPGFRKKKLET